MFEKAKLELIKHIDWMNRQHKNGDLPRNRTNYGIATVYAKTIREMGHEVDLRVYGDGDFLVTDGIMIDRELIIFRKNIGGEKCT